MNQLSYLLITASLLLPAAAFATPEASALDGTWKQDMKTAKFAGKPYILSVQDGIFECNCVPPQKFAADGKPHTLEILFTPRPAKQLTPKPSPSARTA